MTASLRPRSTTISLEAKKLLEAFDLDPALVPGAANVVTGHLSITASDHVTLLCDTGEEGVARAILAALDDVGATVTVYLLTKDVPESESVANRVATTLATGDAAIYVFAEVPRADTARARWLTAGRGSRQALLAAVSPTVARQSLRASAAEVTRISSRVADRLRGASSIVVTTAMGTNVTSKLASPLRLRTEDGAVGDGIPVPMLPCGEVLVAPQDVVGQVVADGGVWLDGRTALGLTSRLVLTFADGRLTDAKGADAERLLAHFEEQRISRNVAAIGFGTNPSVLTPVRELSQDVRMPGFHIVLGRARELEDVTSARVHVLARRPDVRCDTQVLLANGRFARDLVEG